MIVPAVIRQRDRGEHHACSVQRVDEGVCDGECSMLTAMSVRPVELGRSGDTAILARLLEGDTAALRAAYDCYGSLVFGLAKRVTGNTSIAEDVAQEVFLHLWEHPDAVDLSRGSLRSYLGVVAHRRSVDAVRRVARSHNREERAGRDQTGFSEGHETDVVDADDTARRTRRLRTAIGALPREQREALELAYFGDCTYREVATALGIPEGTAKSRLRLALAKLRDLIETQDRLAQA